MRLRYKRLTDRSMPPLKSRIEDAGIDFKCSEPVEWVMRGDGSFYAIARTGIAIEIPRSYYLQTAPRSSMLFQHNVAVFASVIDTGYTGEITFLLHYLGDKTPPPIDRGSKVAQCVLVQVPMIDTVFEEVDVLPKYSSRDNKGFGSSGS